MWKDGEGESQGNSAGQSAGEDKKAEESREEEEEGEEEQGERILAASLAFVPQHGWSTEAIAEGARSLGLSGTVHAIFHRGGYDIVSFFEHQCNEKLTSYLKQLSDPQGERSEQHCLSPLYACCNLTTILYLSLSDSLTHSSVSLSLSSAASCLGAVLCVRQWSIA